jgi:hypothetical protein
VPKAAAAPSAVPAVRGIGELAMPTSVGTRWLAVEPLDGDPVVFALA